MIYQIILNNTTGSYYVYSEQRKRVIVTKRLTSPMIKFMNLETTKKGEDGNKTVWFRKR